MVRCTVKLPSGEVQTFYREELLEAIRHIEEVYYPMGVVEWSLKKIDKQEGGGG